MLKHNIASAERQIDALVYELCDLTEEESRIVEGGWKYGCSNEIRLGRSG